MRVSIMGQAAFGEAILARLREEGVEVVGVSAPAPREGGRPDALWAAAESLGLPCVSTTDLKQGEGLAAWRKLEADLCVMAFVTEIIPAEALAAPKLGSIQFHPSLLPLHRGSSAINWAIINGDVETGLSVFWTDAGVDTGPILLQKRVPIEPTDTVGSLYFEKLFPMGVEGIATAVAMVSNGTAPKNDQTHADSTYEPPCGDAHAGIRWYEPAARIYALVRGCNPQPGAWTTHDNTKLRLFDCSLSGVEEPGMPGRVLRIDEDGFDVRLNGGVLRILRVQPEGGRKVSAGEWAASVGLKAGYRFR
ncbi:MAG: methionyl-tRNA formyltransferase [Tepidiformaceae bacterium]